MSGHVDPALRRAKTWVQVLWAEDDHLVLRVTGGIAPVLWGIADREPLHPLACHMGRHELFVNLHHGREGGGADAPRGRAARSGHPPAASSGIWQGWRYTLHLDGDVPRLQAFQISRQAHPGSGAPCRDVANGGPVPTKGKGGLAGWSQSDGVTRESRRPSIERDLASRDAGWLASGMPCGFRPGTRAPCFGGVTA